MAWHIADIDTATGTQYWGVLDTWPEQQEGVDHNKLTLTEVSSGTLHSSRDDKLTATPSHHRPQLLHLYKKVHVFLICTMVDVSQHARLGQVWDPGWN